MPTRLRRRIDSGTQRLRRWLVCALMLALPGTVASAALPGADSPELAQAVQTWLDNDDQTSLPTMSRLAKNDNIAAALLLARIERTTRHDSPFVRAKSRKQRHALFRRPTNYIFAPSWIGWYAYKGQELAVLFEAVDRSRSDAWLAHQLVDMGERQAADTLIRRVAFYGDGQQRAQISGANQPLRELDPYVAALHNPASDSRLGLNALVHMLGKQALDGLAPEDIDQAASFLQTGMPFEHLQADSPLFEALAQRIREMPAMRPIDNQCRQICPNDVEKCSVTVLGLLGGYYDAIRIDSPLESVIDQDRFLSSDRASAMALRRASLGRYGAAQLRASSEAIWPYCQCLALAVQSEQASHGLRGR